MIVGDINVHNQQWLKFSLGTTAEGAELHDITTKEGLRQIVKSPTRYANLLDLVITDMPSRATVGGEIRDHGYVLIEMAFGVARTTKVKRTVWNYKNADWDLLKDCLDEESWDFLRRLDPDEGTIALTKKIMELSESIIGKREVHETKSTHPWMTQSIVDCIAAKHAAEGTNDEQRLTEVCSQEILTARAAYIKITRAKLRSMKQGSKL